LKYLVIAALLLLVLLLIYSRIHPYIKLLQKMLGVVKTVTSPTPETSRSAPGSVESKLVRCVGCGTWVPADRAIGAGVGSQIYCSRECFEKPLTKRSA
jgi:hypothetical protein